jgi:hypothetical protein
MLALLGSAAKQQYQLFAIPAEIYSITGTEIDPVFVNTAADTFYVRKVPVGQPRNCDDYLSCGCRVEAIKPLGIRTAAVWFHVLENINRIIW